MFRSIYLVIIMWIQLLNNYSLELQTILLFIWAHIYNDFWWMTILPFVNSTYWIIKIVKYYNLEIKNFKIYGMYVDMQFKRAL
jgi:hypothetical protein